MAITFGVHIGPQNISIDDLRRLWRYADAHGFKWISVWDHFYEAPPVDSSMDHFEALTLMAAIACETQNARIGNYVPPAARVVIVASKHAPRGRRLLLEQRSHAGRRGDAAAHRRLACEAVEGARAVTGNQRFMRLAI